MRVSRLIARYFAPTIALSLFLSCASGAALLPQDAKSAVEEPEYNGHFALLGPDGKLMELEAQKMTMQAKSHNHFFSASVSAEQTVPGASSPVRVAPDAHFVVKMPMMNGMDPNQIFALKPFVVQKGQRMIMQSTAQAGVFQSAKSEQAQDTALQVTFKKYGANSLEVIPSQPLRPGEYVLEMNNGVMGVYCFGVDAK